MFIYGEWEYHPIYGSYSRIVYKKAKEEKSFVMIGREYKTLNG